MESRANEPPHTGEGPLAARFHAAHHLTRDPPMAAPGVSRDVLEAVAGAVAEPAREQLQRQAAELAEHLQSRQRELEAWEARLNTRAADHDAEVRSARLWLSEQRERLADEVAAWEARGQALDRRAADLVTAGATAERLQRQAAALDARQGDLERRERDLDLRTRQWGEQVTVWERRRDGTEATLRAQAAALEQQRHDLQRAHAATATLHAQLRQELDAQRALTQTLAAERQSMATRQTDLERLRSGVRELAHMYEQQRQAEEQTHQHARARTRWQRARIARYLQDRRAELQRQQATLREGQTRLAQRHQMLQQRAAQLELEERALVEQRLARVPCGPSPRPDGGDDEEARFEQAARAYLSRQLQALEIVRGQHRHELRELVASLSQEHAALQRRHEALGRWSDSRQQELDARAAHLATRERTLLAAQERWQQEQQVWVDALDRQLAAACTRDSLPAGPDIACSNAPRAGTTPVSAG